MNIAKFKIDGFIRLLIFVLPIVILTGCLGHTVKTDKIYGKVVDSETNEPIEDVIVIGYWPGYTFYLFVSTAPTVEVLETITDKNGDYLIPGWVKNSLDRTFREGDPLMYFYKTGYEIKMVKNAFNMKTFNRTPGYFSPWRAEWNGKAIKLKKFKGDNRSYREYLNQEYYDYNFRQIFNYCKYLNVPRLLISMEEYYQTQPDYRPPGWTVKVGDMMTHNNYRSKGITHPATAGAAYPGNAVNKQDNRPLPAFLSITQLEGLGRRCEITPIEYLNRIMNNEKDLEAKVHG